MKTSRRFARKPTRISQNSSVARTAPPCPPQPRTDAHARLAKPTMTLTRFSARSAGVNSTRRRGATMRRRRPWFDSWAGVFAVLGALTAAPLPAPTADAGGAAGARNSASSAQKKGALPPGHPPTDTDQAALPPGHPPTGAPDVDEEEGEDESLPPGHPPTGARQPASVRERLPEDASDIDEQLPAGAIAVEVRDASDQPIPRVDVTLGILQQSVAKGESRRHVQRQADEGGNVRFDGLEFGGGVAYRVTVPWGSPGGVEPATYAAPPFQLDLHHGQRVRIHLYPVTNRIAETMLGM